MNYSKTASDEHFGFPGLEIDVGSEIYETKPHLGGELGHQCQQEGILTPTAALCILHRPNFPPVHPAGLSVKAWLELLTECSVLRTVLSVSQLFHARYVNTQGLADRSAQPIALVLRKGMQHGESLPWPWL